MIFILETSTVILELTRGHVRVKLADGRVAQCKGELYLPAPKSYGWQVWMQTMTWDPPYENGMITTPADMTMTPEDRMLIRNTLQQDFEKAGMQCEFD